MKKSLLTTLQEYKIKYKKGSLHLGLGTGPFITNNLFRLTEYSVNKRNRHLSYWFKTN